MNTDDTNTVFFSEEDFRTGNFRNGIWVEIPVADSKHYSDFQNSHILIRGRFDAHDQGDRGLWNGSIKEISRIDFAIPKDRTRENGTSTNDGSASEQPILRESPLHLHIGYYVLVIGYFPNP